MIILIAYDDEAYRQAGLGMGARTFLEKKRLGLDLWPTILRVTAESSWTQKD